MNSCTSLKSAIAAALFLAASGCATPRQQESQHAYVSDTNITSEVKTRLNADNERPAWWPMWSQYAVEPTFGGNKGFNVPHISVETLNGTVILSGFARSDTEKAKAENIARTVNGVLAVKNDVEVRP